MRFRPCIDLRNGRVVQIVGSSLQDQETSGVKVNFEAEQDSAYFARLYQADNLPGGHVISLGDGNKEPALLALKSYPGGMQMGGGITADNATEFLDAGASHIIVTSYVFHEGRVDEARLQKLQSAVGKPRLVLDLSCRKRDDAFWIVTDRWQKFSTVQITQSTLEWFAQYCDEFLIHAVDVEGKRMGIDAPLVSLLGQWSPIPVTYAGGAKSLADLDTVKELGKNRVDLSIGSALDIFGGDVPYIQVVAWQRHQETTSQG